MKKIFTFLSLTVMLAFTSQAAYYLVGNEPFGKGWTPADGIELTLNSEGLYSYSATINGTIWFVLADGLDEAGDWTNFNNNLRIGPTGGDQTIDANEWITVQKSGGDHGAYRFTGTGSNYEITYNPYISKIYIKGEGGEIVISTYTVAGTPTSIFGSEWTATDVNNDMTKLADGTYELTKYGCELAEGTQIAFKVVGNHDWGFAWPADNYTYDVTETGAYDVHFTFDPEKENEGVGIELIPAGSYVIPDELYILGEANGNGWDPSVGVPMTTEDNVTYTATITTEGANIDENDGIGYSYFSFTAKLGENSEDWSGIAPYRIGATEDGFPLTEDMFGVEVGMGNFGTSNSFKIPAGEYELTVNRENKTLVVNKVQQEPTEAPVITTQLTDDAMTITATGEGEVILYVNGEQVENPYTIARGEEDVTVTATATAQGEGKLISEVATLEVVVPAKEAAPKSAYKLEKVWEIADLAFIPVNDARQAFGMNGKFYINNKADQAVMVIDENGLTNTTYPGGTNCGITRDEAGNIVISNAAFPGAWTDATIKVVNPETGDVKEYTVPEECGIEGRCDFIGFAKGDLMEDGVIYLAGAATSGVSIMTIAGGEVSIDDCYMATCDGLTPSSSTVINYYTDLNGDDAMLYVTRNAKPNKLAADGDNFTATAITLPGKGNTNGVFPFVWDGKELFIYPQSPDYQDAFAIAEDGADEPIVAVPSTVAANGNGFQADWFNAEVDDKGVTIYQYYPGTTLGHITVYRLTKDEGGVDEMIVDNNKVVSSVRYFNIMGQEMTEANGITIVVTTYTDGSHNAAKVIK